MPAPRPVRPADRTALEHWLRSNGMPNFVHGYADPLRVAPRAAWVGVVLAVVVGVLLAVLGAGGAGVVFGALAALVITGAIAYVVIASGVPGIAAFGLRWLTRVLATGGGRLVSVLPLLLVAVTFLFLGAETWQSIGRLRGSPLVLTTFLFVVLGVAFLLRQMRPDLEAAHTFDDAGTLRDCLPAEFDWTDEQLQRALATDHTDLRRGERLNLRATTAIAQLTVAVVVGLAVFVFFLVFGVLVVGGDTVRSWSTADPQTLASAGIAGHTYVLTFQHIRVSAFLGVFSALYFVVSSTSDSALRANLSTDARKHAQTCLAVRAVYRPMTGSARREGATHQQPGPGEQTPHRDDQEHPDPHQSG